MRLRRKSKVIVEFPWRRRGAKGERAKEGKRGFEFVEQRLYQLKR